MWKQLGRVLYRLAWPVLWLYLYGSERTRVMLVDGPNILVVRAWLSDGRWKLPGGGIAKHEPALDGAIREAQEEVGLQITALRPLGTMPARGNGFRYQIHLFHGAASVSQKITLGKPEITAAAWLPAASLDASNADADTLAAIAKLASNS